MTARYICFEGTEGVGKTTQTQNLVDYLKEQGFKVLQTKEPGVHHLPVTMKLRELMLSNEFDDQLTTASRELISQAIRSIHLEKLIFKDFDKYDFIVQDRGILSGLAYGEACDNDIQILEDLAELVTFDCHNSPDLENIYQLYDSVIYLTGNVGDKLNVAKNCKQEYTSGDAIEAKGLSFMQKVKQNMDVLSPSFNTIEINVDGKTINEVFDTIKTSLQI